MKRKTTMNIALISFLVIFYCREINATGRPRVGDLFTQDERAVAAMLAKADLIESSGGNEPFAIKVVPPPEDDDAVLEKMTGFPGAIAAETGNSAKDVALSTWELENADVALAGLTERERNIQGKGGIGKEPSQLTGFTGGFQDNPSVKMDNARSFLKRIGAFKDMWMGADRPDLGLWDTPVAAASEFNDDITGLPGSAPTFDVEVRPNVEHVLEAGITILEKQPSDYFSMTQGAFRRHMHEVFYFTQMLLRGLCVFYKCKYGGTCVWDLKEYIASARNEIINEAVSISLEMKVTGVDSITLDGNYDFVVENTLNAYYPAAHAPGFLLPPTLDIVESITPLEFLAHAVTRGIARGARLSLLDITLGKISSDRRSIHGELDGVIRCVCTPEFKGKHCEICIVPRRMSKKGLKYHI